MNLKIYIKHKYFVFPCPGQLLNPNSLHSLFIYNRSNSLPYNNLHIHRSIKDRFPQYFKPTLFDTIRFYSCKKSRQPTIQESVHL